jgi:cobyrinic acid a,c-diamide synthase
LANYRDGLSMYGVAANRIGSAYHAQLLQQSLPASLHWLGALPREDRLVLPERHLGLIAADELSDLDARLDALAEAWSQHAATELPPPVAFQSPGIESIPPLLQSKRIAVARDDAFCFLYPANLDLLREAGAELHFFSPLAGDALPECDAVWLPGGYPELHLDALSKRHDLHASLRAHRDAGKPMLAECGGLLFALGSLADREGHAAPMASLLRGHAAIQPRLAALGLQGVNLPEGELRGHTFHYAHASIDAEPLAHAFNPNHGPCKEAVYRDRRMTASFVHFYFPSNMAAALRLFLP